MAYNEMQDVEAAPSGRLERVARIVGEEGLERLRNATVAVFGLGGVGASCAEALARGGVGRLVLIDADCVEESNINRQALAFYSTVGMRKTDAMRAMIKDIAPDAQLICHDAFVLPENVHEFLDPKPDFIIDALDTVAAKLALARAAQELGVAFVGSMGAANKRRPERLAFADIYDTSVCPLCKAVRKEARKQGIERMRVLYSNETPLTPRTHTQAGASVDVRRTFLGTLSFMPPIMGQMIAGDVMLSILGLNEEG